MVEASSRDFGVSSVERSAERICRTTAGRAMTGMNDLRSLRSPTSGRARTYDALEARVFPS
jgi:hypothetical protein